MFAVPQAFQNDDIIPRACADLDIAGLKMTFVHFDECDLACSGLKNAGCRNDQLTPEGQI